VATLKQVIMRIAVLIMFLFVVAGTTGAQAAVHVFTSDSLPRTLGSGYQNDTIRFSGTSVRSSTNGLIINTSGVFIEGQGDTLFYGTGGGSYNEGIYVNGTGDNFKVRDLTIIHDPGNDGVIEDTSSNALENTAMYLLSPDGVTIINCNFVVYGDNAKCIDCQGQGTATENVVIDGCHFWNYCRSFTSRHSYDGAAVRLEMRGSFTGADFGAHIYRSVVHTAPQMGFALFGNGNTLCPGIEVAYCTTYVDHHNAGGSSANQYGILFRFVRAPMAVHHNYISSGTKYGGSRGMMLENVVGTPSDWVRIHDNHMETTCGPDAENPSGTNRVLRLRAIDGGYWDYVHIYDNVFTATTDNLASTTHIGTDASVFQFGAFGAMNGYGHGLFERNVVTYRALTAGTDGTAAEFSVESNFSAPVPITIRHNKYFSSQRVVWTADEYNAQSSHDLTFFEDTLGFLPPGDPGVLVNPVTWSIGYYAENDHGESAVNCYYVNGASDKDIVLYPNGGSHEFSLIQREPIVAVGNNDSLVASFNLRITNRQGTQIVNTSVAGGVASPDLTYWYESTGLGAPIDYNPFTFVVKAGSDSTISQRTVDYKTTSVVLSLPNTRGTLPLDYAYSSLGNVSDFTAKLVGTDRYGEDDLVEIGYRIPDTSSADSVVTCFSASTYPDSLSTWRISRPAVDGLQVRDTVRYPILEPANLYISYWTRTSGSIWAVREQASVYVVDSIPPSQDTVGVAPWGQVR